MVSLLMNVDLDYFLTNMFRMLLFLTFRFYGVICRQILLQKQSLNLFRTTMTTASSIVGIFQNVTTFVLLL